ncbi:MAG: hypothetical protein QXU32_00535 [Nitrososphaerales archaeon]
MNIKKYYVDSKALENYWTKWYESNDPDAWQQLLAGIYQISFGVAIHFRPHNDDEHRELAHEAFILTVEKIKDGRLRFTPGRAPVFNLLTTTIFRHLYSKMNRDSRRKSIMAAYKQKLIDDNAFEVH